MNILVTGASGYLGSAIQEHLSGEGHSVTGTYSSRSHPHLAQLDITDDEQVHELFSQTAPDYVVHCVGLVDECTSDPNLARRVNLEGTERITRFSAEMNAPVVYISSAAVFDGLRGQFSEERSPSPVSPYGISKALCEEVVARRAGNLIVRPSWFVGYAPYGMEVRGFGKILKGLRTNTPAELDDEWHFTPSSVSHIARVVEWWLHQKSNRPEIIHVASPEVTTKYQLALGIARSMGISEANMAHLLGTKEPTGDVPMNLLDVSHLAEINAPQYQIDEMLAEVRNKEGVRSIDKERLF